TMKMISSTSNTSHSGMMMISAIAGDDARGAWWGNAMTHLLHGWTRLDATPGEGSRKFDQGRRPRPRPAAPASFATIAGKARREAPPRFRRLAFFRPVGKARSMTVKGLPGPAMDAPPRGSL